MVDNQKRPGLRRDFAQYVAIAAEPCFLPRSEYESAESRTIEIIFNFRQEMQCGVNFPFQRVRVGIRRPRARGEESRCVVLETLKTHARASLATYQTPGSSDETKLLK